MSQPPITLKGGTWSHTRGYLPMVATAQRYAELHPGVEIEWRKRSLKDFERFPVHELAQRYDLLVIDHPFIGEAVARRIFLPLDDLLPTGFLAEQAAHSVGVSHASYQWSGSHWALAIDAAAPVAAWRPDLLERAGLSVPHDQAELLEIARQGRLEMPTAPINCLMAFYGLCLAGGGTPFSMPSRVIEPDLGAAALQLLRALVRACEPACLGRNPIQSLDRLASSANQQLAYCLFPYGYSNYAQDGYASHLLAFGDVPAFGGRGPIPTVLGGTGLAISAHTTHRREAADYAAFVASAEIQRTVYTRSGGQPGHRQAWLDEENNRRTHGYFRATLPTLDRAFLRPRYSGYLHGFQDPAGEVVHRCVRGELGERETLTELDRLYTASLPADTPDLLPHASP